MSYTHRPYEVFFHKEGIMISKYALIPCIIVLHLFAAGISLAGEPQSGEATQAVEPYVATFAYAPSPEKAPNSQGVTVTVAKTSFLASETPKGGELWEYQIKVLGKVDPSTGETLWFAFPQFQNLAAKLRRDVAEILFAKGFNVRGPYESPETIPAADKKTIDLYFVPKMKLSFAQQFKKWKKSDKTVDEDIEVYGTIILEAHNIATRELLWTKTIPMEKIAFTSRMSSSGFSANDRFNSIMNEAAKGVERQYPTLMSGVMNAVDSQEIRSLKKSGAGKTGY